MNEPECRHPANALLPWYVRRTLQQEELVWVRDHVESCPACSRECEELASAAEEASTVRAPLDQPPAAPAAGRRWATCLPFLLAAVLAVPALMGARWIYLGLPGIFRPDLARLRPALYLDLESGPTRAVEPLKLLTLRPGVESIVVSFIPPLIEEARLEFDLEGPHGGVLVRGEPIHGVDTEGRCTFSLPVALFDSPGGYAIVVREETPLGEVRLYPFPFQAGRVAGVQELSASPGKRVEDGARPPGGAPSISSGGQ